MPDRFELRVLKHRSALAITIVLIDRKSTRLNSSHLVISYAVFCLKKTVVSGVSTSPHPAPSILKVRPLGRLAMSHPTSSAVRSRRHAVSKSYAILKSFFFNDTATTEIYTLSLHDALPI